MNKNYDVPESLNPREYRFTTQLDNHNPPRTSAIGYLCTYDRGFADFGRTAFKIEKHHFRDAEKAIYLLDFGTQILPCYVVTWDQRFVVLHAFPLNTGWTIGPNKAYHLKIHKN